jgi:BMFP domain-containing protein YqiC
MSNRNPIYCQHYEYLFLFFLLTIPPLNPKETAMAWPPKHLEELIQQLMDALPTGVRDIPADVEKNIRAILYSAFAKMDLVTREEFDVQVAVLRRTREKLVLLEKQLQAATSNPKET